MKMMPPFGLSTSVDSIAPPVSKSQTLSPVSVLTAYAFLSRDPMYTVLPSGLKVGDDFKAPPVSNSHNLVPVSVEKA